MIKFRIGAGESSLKGKLVYRPSDFAFDTEPRPSGCSASVSINDLELMVSDIDNRLLFVSGYCPQAVWQASRLEAPRRALAALYVDWGQEVIPGITYSIQGTGVRWPVLVDRKSGWIHIGSAPPKADSLAVTFAPGAAAVVEHERIEALWLRLEPTP